MEILKCYFLPLAAQNVMAKIMTVSNKFPHLHLAQPIA